MNAEIKNSTFRNLFNMEKEEFKLQKERYRNN